MAKIKISELAAQLDKRNNEIIGALEALGIENNGKKFVAASSIDEAAADKVKEKLGVRAEAQKEKTAAGSQEQRKAEAPKTEASKAEAPKTEAPKKKIFMVRNPQNSSQGGRGNGNAKRPSGNPQMQGQRPPQGQQGRPGSPAQRPAQQTARPAEAQSRPAQGQSSRPAQGQGSRPAETQAQTKPAQQQGRPAERSRNTAQKQTFSQDRQQAGGQRGSSRSDFQQGRPGSSNRNSTQKGKPEMKAPEVRAAEIVPEKKTERRAEKFQERDRDKEREDNKNSRQEKQIQKTPARKPETEKQASKEPEIKVIRIGDTITIKELADKMKLQPSMIVKKMFMQGKLVTINQEIDFETAEEIALEFDVIAEQEEKVDVIEELLREEEEDESKMVSRPPVVCVMGHVDHGKTSLLDAIRSTNVTSREAGGITQHIGAYMVEINGEKITFLDTPGHEAFTAMRMRGAQSTDIAVLVVAADDGVMPQTIEAINHAKAAGIEIIVAINKIDKPSANIDRVKQELIEYELVPEDWGGNTVFVPVSAHTREGIENLLEMILLTAEVKELKANPKRKARGLVIEAQLDKGRGPVATVLVQKGTLRVGDVIAAGSSHGKVRAMIDDKGRNVREATPSTPVEILGLKEVPNAGEIFVACENEKEARSFAETFISQGKEKLLEETRAKMSLDDLFSKIQAGNLKELKLIVKADVQGSVEAMKQSLLKLSNEEVVVKVIHGGVGAINESDVILASASDAIIIGFNVKPDNTAKGIAERENVDVRLYRVIYNAIEDVEAAMKGMLEPVYQEKVIGHAEVRQVFKASGLGNIAGSYILDGKFQRGCKCRVSRNGDQLFDGALASLKRFKDDVKEVNAGYECGLVFEKFNDIQEGDQVEAYIMEEVPR